MAFLRRRRFGNPDRNQKPIVQDLRRLPASVAITTGVGGGFGDIVVGFQGITVIGEVKRNPKRVTPATVALRESQDKFRAEWRGGPILTFTDSAQAIQELISLDCRTPPWRQVPVGGWKVMAPNGRTIAADTFHDLVLLLTTKDPAKLF